MLDFMFTAKVGDDVFGEDPTVNELETYAAQLFGKEAALFCSSGTQTNQIAINVHVQPGGEVICHKESHVFKYEGGGIARNSGASIRTLEGDRGRLKAEEVAAWINPEQDESYSRWEPCFNFELCPKDLELSPDVISRISPSLCLCKSGLIHADLLTAVS